MKKQLWNPLRRMLALLLCAAMLVGLLPGLQHSAQASSDGLRYEISNGQVTITGCDYDLSGELIIPATIEGYPVTALGNYAIRLCQSLTSVTIPDSITSIGNYAFFLCTSLTNVTIPDSVTSIGESAFNSCESLTSVTIPDSVTAIGDYAFSYCTSLTDVTLPDGITGIGIQMFNGCGSLTDVTIPNSVTSIGEQAFTLCNNLTSVTIPKSVTSIGDWAFSNCADLENIYFAGDAPSFGAGPFYGVKGATVWYISGNAGWDAVTSSALTDGTITIQETDHMDEDNNGTCDKCGTVLAEPVPEGLSYEISNGEVTITDCDTSLSGSLTIPATIEGYPVTAIGDFALYGCVDLTNITIPLSVVRIGYGAFHGCYSLSEIAIPSSVTSLGHYAFAYCNSLTEVEIPSGVTEIGDYAFVGCSGLTGITISDTVISIGQWAFSTGTNLTAITVSENNPSYTSDSWGVLYNKDKTQLLQMPAGYCGTYTIPNSVTGIGDYAFSGCSGLTGITIPGSVTQIGASAFDSCYGLISVTMAEGVVSIGAWAFNACDSLTNITIPCSVTSIGDSAFYRCTDLENIYFGADAPSFGYCPFYGVGDATLWYISGTDGWDSLSSYTLVGNYGRITLEQTKHMDENADGICDNCGKVLAEPVPEGLVYEISNGQVTITDCAYSVKGELTIPATIEGYPVTAIGERAFSYCSGLTGVTIPHGVTSIGAEAFSDCTGMTYVSIPGSVTSIGKWAFLYCICLTDVTIPSGVASIGDEAFRGCTGLAKITVPDTVTSIGKNAFSGCSSLSGFTVSENNPAYSSDACGVLFNKDKTQLLQMPAGYSGTYTVPDGVTAIEAYAFQSCNSLTGVTIPGSVASVGEYAFAYCENLSDVYFAGDAPSFGDAPFLYVSSITLRYGCGADGWDSVIAGNLSNGTITLQAEDHSFTDYIPDGNATCTQDGTKTAKCDNCDATDTVTDKGSAGGHKPVFVPGTVTCTQAGYIDHYRCDCGRLFADATGLIEITQADIAFKALGHIDENEDLDCDRCGICICQHNYEATVVPPTYFEQGYTLHTCSACGDTYKDTYVDPLERIDLSNATLALEYMSAFYEGQPLTPDVTVTYEGKTYASAGELKLTYANNDQVGTATVTVEGINRFKGTAELQFEISYEVIPEQIVNVFAVGEIGKISLSWGESSEVNTDSYNIYRKAEGEAEYQLIQTVNGRDMLFYEDKAVEREKTYSYYVTGVGLYGAESQPSQTVTATVQVDKTAPTVLKLTPAAASVIAGKTTLSAVARDNVAVTKVAYFYTLDNGETWVKIGETANGDFSIALDVSDFEGASVKVKAVAYDAEGNESEPRTVVYSLDNVGPDKVTGLSAVAVSSKITLSWKDVTANDAASFILQTKSGEEWKTVASNITTLGYTVTGLQPGTEYIYRVACVDTHGNIGEYSDEFTASTTADITAPVITEQSSNAGRYNSTIYFSATAKDDCDVEAVEIQVSADLSSWTTVSKKTYADRSYKQTYSYIIDLSTYAEGSLYVRAIATDFSGNISDTGKDAPYTEYFVDRTAPKAPADVAANGNDGYITVSWSMGSEADLGKYFVYRATSAEGEYQLIASSLSSLNYHDRDVQSGTQYYYKVKVSDGCGNMSAYSPVVSSTMSADTQKPEITSISATYEQKISSNSHTVHVAATDNNQLSRIVVEYCTSVDPAYAQLVVEESISGYYKSIPVTLPITSLTDGDVIYLRAYAVDMAGLRSGYATAKYTLDTTPPEALNYTASVDASTVTLSWKDNGESDLSGFKVYRSVAGGSFKLLGSRGISSTGAYSFIDTITAKESNTYTYQLEAIDRLGNTASWQSSVDYVYVEPEEDEDEYVNQAPVALMNVPGYMTVGVEQIFDAAGSWDDIDIIRYAWDFGDGTVSSEIKPIKSYQAVGSYIVKLSVTDTEGCTSTVTQTVEVKDRNMLGTLNVKVVDENGKALSYVPVYFDLGSNTQKILYTDASGVASLQMVGGTHTVGMYASGYLPVKKDVVVLSNATRTVTLTTVEEEIVTGNFEITRMTFDEIVAAGIDVYDPANQNVYSATVRVTYGATTPMNISYVRNDDRIIDYVITDDNGKPIKTYKNKNGEIRAITGITYIPSKTVGSGGHNTNADVVAIVDIPASASYLKEFFDVRLHIVNNAASEFALEMNEVVLNVPEGLMLMDSVAGGYCTSNTAKIASIKGQETVTLAWVLRGDRAGEYDLSADFTGTLAQFDELVTARFETDEPIKVYGLEGVKFRILAADEIHNDTLYFNIELENERDIDIYMPAIGLTDKIMNVTESVLNDKADGDFTAEAYILNAYVQTGDAEKQYLPVTIDANGRAATPIEVLAPGQKLVMEYVAYNAVNYDGVAHFKDAAIVEFEGILENIEAGSFHKELYSFKNYPEKLDAALSGSNADAADALNYIKNDGNYYYVEEAEKIGDTSLKNLYKVAGLVLNGDLSSLTQDEERDLIQRIILMVLSHKSVTELSEDYLMSKYNKAVVSMIDAVKIGTIDSFVSEGLSADNVAEAFADITKNSKELAVIYREKGAEAFEKELSKKILASGLGITVDAGAMLAMGGEIEAFSKIWDVEQELLKSFFTAAEESEREALYFSVLKYQCNAEIAAVILDAIIENTEAGLQEELQAAIASQLLPAGAGILALRDVGLGEKTLIWQTAKDMKKTLESERETFYGSVKDVLNYVEDGSQALASLAIKALVKKAIGSTPLALVSAGFTVIDALTGWGSYVKQQDTMEIYKACSDAFLGAYQDSIATRDAEADLYSMTYLRALCEIRLNGEAQYKAFINDYLNGVYLVPLSEETVLKQINKVNNTGYTTIAAWWDEVQYNTVHARDVLFNIEGISDIEIPRAPVVSLDYELLQTVQSFTPEYEYCFADGVWMSCNNAPISFEVDVTPSTLRVRKAAGADTLAGEITTVKIYARKDLSKLISVRFDGVNYLISNLSGAYYYQVLFTNTPEGRIDWSKAQKIAGSDDVVTLNGVGEHAYVLIRSCTNADRQETTSNPLTCTVLKKQKLNLQIEGSGSVFQTDRTGHYFKGDTVDLVAAAIADAAFVGWYVNGSCVSTDAHYLVEMMDDLQIKAVFTGSQAQSVSIGKLPQKLEYQRGEALDLDGLEVLITYENGNAVATDHYAAYLTSNTVGAARVEIAFGEKTTGYDVMILCGDPQENNPLGHSYEYGICTRCGAVDPAFEMPTKVDGLVCAGTTNSSFTLTWDALSGDVTYWVYVDGRLYTSTTGTTATVEGRKAGMTYSVAVIAKVNGTILSLDDADVISVITDAYSVSSTHDADAYSVWVDWEAEDCTKAWLYYGTSPDELKLYTVSTDGHFYKDSLRSNTTYYFRLVYLIGEVKDDSGKITTFGQIVYGDIFEVTTKNDDRLNVVREGNRLTWGAVENSSKYWVIVNIDGKDYIYSTLETGFTLTRFTVEQLDDATITVRGLNSYGTYNYNPVIYAPI